MTTPAAQNGVFTTRDQHALFTRTWIAPGAAQPKDCNAAVLLLHGLGEHCGRYEALAQWFAARGFAVFSYDHFGHGNSPGARGDLPSPADFTDHGLQMCEHVNAVMGRPPLLLGHSLGGAVAASMVLLRDARVAGLVLSSPALDPGLGAAQKLLLAMMEKIAPALGVGNGVKPQFLSHDSAVNAAYRADPLVHAKITARTVRWLLTVCSQLEQSRRPLPVPCLLLAAMDDRLVNPQGSERFAQRQRGDLLQFEPLQTYYHEIFNEDQPRRAQVLERLGLWLDRLLK